MLNQLVEYIKITKISLEQDLDNLNLNEFGKLWAGDEEVSLNGQIYILNHILQYAMELDKPIYEGV